MKKTIAIFLFLAFSANAIGQTIFHTEDMNHFWQAFDSIQTTNDKEKQMAFVQKYYLDNASEGLKYTAKVTYNDGDKPFAVKDWTEMMVKNKDKFQRIRPFTLQNLENQKLYLQKKFAYFKELYPDFKDGNVFFVVGMGIFGGRADGRNLIIGVEVMAKDTPDWATSIVLHEYVHTLQTVRFDALLQHSIMEGTADFIAELVNQKSLTETYPGGYIDFGNKNEAAVWAEFKKYIASNEKGEFFDWLYGQKGITINDSRLTDLGYFMGYKICQAYYNNAPDKKRAIKEIIEWDLSTEEKAKDFLLKSNYVPKADLTFVQNLKFSKLVIEKKVITMVVSGYKLDKENVVFQFNLPSSYDKATLKCLTVAGNFNGWNPKDLNYKMQNTEKNTFELTIPKTQLKDKMNQFKFVVNGESWQSPPENASNIADGNLTLEIK